jgi:hypothetical protein
MRLSCAAAAADEGTFCVLPPVCPVLIEVS